MGQYDLAREAQPDPGALLLGGEKGKKDVLPQAFRNPGAVVPDLDRGSPEITLGNAHFPPVQDIGRMSASDPLRTLPLT